MHNRLRSPRTEARQDPVLLALTQRRQWFALQGLCVVCQAAEMTDLGVNLENQLWTLRKCRLAGFTDSLLQKV